MGCNSSSPCTKEADGPSAYLTESQGEAVLPSGSRRPSYWRNHSSNLDDGFDDKFDVASENADATAFVDRLLRECSSKDPSSYAITKILRVEDSAMWRRYQQSKTELSRRRGGKCVPAMDVAASRGQVTTKALIRASAAQEGVVVVAVVVFVVVVAAVVVVGVGGCTGPGEPDQQNSTTLARTVRSALEVIAETASFDQERERSGHGPASTSPRTAPTSSTAARRTARCCRRSAGVCRVCFGEFHHERARRRQRRGRRARHGSRLAAGSGREEPREFIVFDLARGTVRPAVDTEGT